MKYHSTWPIVILLLALAGCAQHRTPDQHAKAFFEDGRGYILNSLKKQGATPEQLDQARAILDHDAVTVTHNIAALFRTQQDLLFAVTTGKDTATLEPLENSAHFAQVDAVHSIGKMHETLRAAVGPDLWQATTVSMEKKMARYLRK